MQLVQLDSSPGQTFNITLNVNNALLTLGLALSYNVMAGYWMMTIFDSLGNLLLSNIPMLTGTWPAGNLLQPYGYLRIGSAFLINVSGDPGDYAGSTNLGSDYQLIWDDNY
jgi:hypothetical protein